MNQTCFAAIICTLFCSLTLSAQKICFKYPKVSSEQFAERLVREKDQVLVISGAGPTGLSDALIAKKYGAGIVIVVEKRDEFSRRNTIALRPQAVEQLRAQHLLPLLEPFAIVPSSAHMTTREHAQVFLAKDTQEPQGAIDFDLDVDQILTEPAWPRLAIEIRHIQTAFAQEVHNHEDIYLLHGSISVIKGQDGKVSVEFTDQTSYGNFTIAEPKLVMIAEGFTSASKRKLAPIIDVSKPNEVIASGTVSLEGIFDFALNQSTGHIALDMDKEEGFNSFAVFRPQTRDMFLNAEVTEAVKHLSPNEIVRMAALHVLESEQDNFTIDRPVSHKKLELKTEESFTSEINFQKSSKVVIADNLVLAGDAVRNGSPTGGVGLSSILSVELAEKIRLFLACWKDQVPLAEALARYENRLLQFADFWHRY